MSGDRFPVMHGSMWKEPQTLIECSSTLCSKCAYRDLENIPPEEFDWETCHHRLVLKGVEEA
jgi:hypothetical protein